VRWGNGNGKGKRGKGKGSGEGRGLSPLTLMRSEAPGSDKAISRKISARERYGKYPKIGEARNVRDILYLHVKFCNEIGEDTYTATGDRKQRSFCYK